MPEIAINPHKTALLIIDMQKHFLDGQGEFFAGLYEQVYENNVIDNIACVLNAARKAKLPIFHITTGHKANRSDVVPTITDMESTAKLPHLVEGSEAVLILQIVFLVAAVLLLLRASLVVYQSLPKWLNNLRDSLLTPPDLDK